MAPACEKDTLLNEVREYFCKMSNVNNITNASEKEFGVRRFYCNIYVSGILSEIQIDSGADVSLISKDVLLSIYPDWQNLPNAEKVEISGVTGTKLKVIASKVIPISFLPENSQGFNHPFVVIGDTGQFLLSSHAMYQQEIGIAWGEQDGKPYLTWEGATGEKNMVPLFPHPRFIHGVNLVKMTFPPGSSVEVDFKFYDRGGSVGRACIYNPSSQLRQPRKYRELFIVPSFSQVIQGTSVRALVKNYSDKRVTILPERLCCDIELEREGNEFLVLDPAVDMEMDIYPNSGEGMHPCRKAVAHLPKRIRKGLRENQSELNVMTEGHAVDVAFVKGVAAGSKERTLEEKNWLLGEIFPDSEDKADFSLQPGSDIGFDFSPPRTVWEQYDIHSIRPQYRPFVRKLLIDNESLFSTSDLDCGDISATLGTFTLPLKKPLPNTSHRTYFMQGRKEQSLKIILSLMLRHGLIRRVKSSSFSSPVFLIEKKDKASLPRLLADVRQLNDHLSPVQQLVPKIQSLLDNIGNLKPVLFSNMDLASAFFSMRADKRTQSMLTLSTQFGLFAAKMGVQGISHIPTLFSDYIYRALHNDLEGQPDPIAFLMGYLDDVLCYSPESNLSLGEYGDLPGKISCFSREEDLQDPAYEKLSEKDFLTACDHWLLIQEVFSRLKYHNFKLKVNKLNLFQDSVSTLGVVVDGQGLSIDPKRVDKILNTPFPTTRKEMQGYCGFLSSIALYTSNEMSHYHGILSELTSNKKKFEVEDKHIQAFNDTKRLLTSSPLFLNFPDQFAPKVLFVDSSDILLGAVLLDLVFPATSLTKKKMELDIKNMREMSPELQEILDDHHFPAVPIRIRKKRNSSFFESVIFLINEMSIGNVPSSQKLLRQAVLCFLENSMLRYNLFPILYGTGNWQEFIQRHQASNSGLDEKGLLIKATAVYLERDIFVFLKGKIRVSRGGEQSDGKPPITLVCKEGEYWPAYMYGDYTGTVGNTLSIVENDLKYMDKQEIFSKLQEFVNHPSRSDLSARVVGYMSKVIPEQDRGASIWKKESMALVNGLHKFKPLIEVSPAVLCLVDSQVVYFLSHNNLLATNLKAKRLGTLLHLEYPNILVAPVKGKDNVSDKLSRLFSLPKVVEDSLALRHLRISGELPEIEGQAFSLEEARKVVSKLQDKHWIEKKCKALSLEETWPSKIGDSLSYKDRVLLDNIRPLKVLGDRLSRINIIEAQESDLRLDGLLADKPNLYKKDELGIVRTIDGGKLVVPADLEGVVLSHSHLVCGHTGWNRLYGYVNKRYYFPGSKEKTRNLASTCQVCAVSNPDSVRKRIMQGILASYPLEIVSCDLLEVEALQGKRQHKILVVVDYFSKAIFAYDLLSFTGKAFINKFKEFLSNTGMITKVLIVDNATIFSSQEVLVFLELVGVKKVRGNANHSRARGMVEGSIKIIQTLLRKLLALSDRYNYEDLLFLAPVLLNRAENPVTRMSPYEILYGRDLSSLGITGNHLRIPEFRVFSETVRNDIVQLKGAMNSLLPELEEKIREEKEKMLRRYNETRVDKGPLKSGQIVFLKDFSIPKSGRARKFRPRYLKSPHVVVSSTKTSVLTMRLADGFVTRHHPDAMIEYKGKEKMPELFEQLPKEVTKFLGEPMTEQKLIELAKEDKLDLIYVDRHLPEREDIVTRSKSKDEKVSQVYEISGILDEDLVDIEEPIVNETTTLKEKKGVKFAE